MSSGKKDTPAVLALNKAARYNFTILESIEAGIELRGSEVKSARQGHMQLKEGYALVRENEILLEGVYIQPYTYTTHSQPDPMRSRKLLLHRNEIRRIARDVATQGLTLIPLKAYVKRGRIKIELGLAKGKKRFDKRESIKNREEQRYLERVHKQKRA